LSPWSRLAAAFFRATEAVGIIASKANIAAMRIIAVMRIIETNILNLEATSGPMRHSGDTKKNITTGPNPQPSNRSRNL
jgi:hypothetical protein